MYFTDSFSFCDNALYAYINNILYDVNEKRIYWNCAFTVTDDRGEWKPVLSEQP